MEAQAEHTEPLARAVLDEARSEAEGIRAEAEAKAEAILKRAQEQAEAERKGVLEKARQDADRLRGQAVATAQLKARTLQLEHREKLLERVFKAAREKLPDIRKRPDYEKIVARLLVEALKQLRVAQAEVRADASTQKFLQEAALDKIAGEQKVELKLGKPLEEGTGLIVDASGGHLHYDGTFETRLSRMQSTLRASVHQVLMGEKL
jgi:V/A-type H+-transporting ATPase subunit E